MGVALNIFGPLLLLAALLAAAFFVFARVRSEYQIHGRLSRPIAILQTGYFCIYALCSYVFLDSRLSHVNTVGLFFFPSRHIYGDRLTNVCVLDAFFGSSIFWDRSR